MKPRKKKIGLLTFGLCLISLGIFLLLDQYYDTPLIKDYFILWPIFLIILGLEFILTKLYYDLKKIDVELSPSILSIILIFVIIFFTLGWVILNKLPFDRSWDWINYLNDYEYRHEVTYDYESGPLDIDDAQILSIKNIRGSIDIKASTDNTLDIKAKIRGSANNKNQAETVLKKVIQVDHGVNTTIDIEQPSQIEEVSVYEVDFTILVPPTLAIKANTQFDDVRIIGLKNDVDINNRHGKVYAEGIDGNVKIENQYDDTRVSNIKQTLSINSRHGQIKVDNIAGDVNIKSEYSDTYCDNIAGNISIDSRHGNVNLENLQGNVTVDNEYDSITLINPSYENAEIKASVDYNDIIIRGLEGIAVDTNGNHSECEAFYGNGSQKIKLKSRHGDITIQAIE